MDSSNSENDAPWSDLDLLSRTASLIVASSDGEEKEVALKHEQSLSEQDDLVAVKEALAWIKKQVEETNYGLLGGLVHQVLESIGDDPTLPPAR